MDAEEELRGFIDNDQFVSFRWFANFLNINVEQSKKLFDEFKASNNDVFATYCVSGQLRNKQQSITIVPEDHLARCKDLFLVINCIHIYSLQKKKFQQSSTISAQLNAADIQQANELIAQQPSCESFLLNSVGGVRLDGSHVKPIGKRVAAMVRVISVADKTDEQMMKSFAKVGGGIEKVGVSSSSSAVKDSGKENSKEKSKASSSVANAFFAKAAAASSSAVNAVTPVATAAAPKVIEANKIARKQSAKASSATEPLSTKLASVADDDKDDDEEDNWTEEGAASYKPDKKRLQSMKKANVILEADEGVRSIPPAVHDPAIDEASSEARKTVPHVRGAMDDYMEDVAVEQYNSGGHSGGDAASISGGGVTKRTKKKLVEKVRVKIRMMMLYMHCLSYNYVFSSDVC